MPNRRLGRCLGAAVIVCYNSWVLAFLGPHSRPLAGYTSELAADDQPAAWVFRTGDLVAAVLMLVIAGRGALGWRRHLGRWTGTVVLAVALAGIATVADVIWTMPCSPTFGSACSAAEGTAPLRAEFLAHSLTSSVVTIAVLVSMSAAALAGRGPRRWAPLGLALLVVASSVGSWLIEMFAGTGQGYVQIFAIVAASVWIAWLAIDVDTGTAPDPIHRSPEVADAE